MQNESHSFDLEKVMQNAREQHIELQQIALIYENLTDNEIAQMEAACLVRSRSGGQVLGTFTADGAAIFADKIVSALYLAA